MGSKKTIDRSNRRKKRLSMDPNYREKVQEKSALKRKIRDERIVEMAQENRENVQNAQQIAENVSAIEENGLNKNEDKIQKLQREIEEKQKEIWAKDEKLEAEKRKNQQIRIMEENERNKLKQEIDKIRSEKDKVDKELALADVEKQNILIGLGKYNKNVEMELRKQLQQQMEMDGGQIEQCRKQQQKGTNSADAVVAPDAKKKKIIGGTIKMEW